MSLATCLVELKSKPLNLTKVAATQLNLSKKASSLFRSIFFDQKVIANLMNFLFEHPLYMKCTVYVSLLGLRKKSLH
jgi:hypothetical protein